MVSAQQRVWYYLNADPSIQHNLGKGLINVRALAKHLIKREQLNASVDSVVSAIRRYSRISPVTSVDKKLENVFKGARVSTANGMAAITLTVKENAVVEELVKTNIDLSDMRVSRGRESIKLMGNEELIEKVSELFSKKEIIRYEKELAEMGMVVSEKAIKTKGVLARIANEISLQNINIKEIVIVPPEFLIYVKERDMVKAHQALIELL